jgi:hypothetical protein
MMKGSEAEQNQYELSERMFGFRMSYKTQTRYDHIVVAT